MAQNETNITVVGNIVADPELRYTPNGVSVANFRVASTPKAFNKTTGQFEDGEPLFLPVNIWRDQAENVSNSLSKGDHVIVTGRLRQRSYEDKNGERRHIYEIEADDVGVSLRFATVEVNKTQRGNNNGYPPQHTGGYQQPQNTGGYTANNTQHPPVQNQQGFQQQQTPDPWQQTAAPQAQPMNQAQQTAINAMNAAPTNVPQSDEPPF